MINVLPRFSQFSETSMGCVLQDFETVTFNLLARKINTMEGGGLVVLLSGSCIP
ncbi:hypothetical protein BS17DRAFT_782771 [Gyrodon lividus]|nr:hypothetical protein BS17DRAFT_782771 [Gyrodon lividus]